MVDVVCVGHICLDFTPKFPSRNLQLKDIFVGGKQSDVEGMDISTGGSVANTGVALNRLGIKTPLMAKVGDDEIGSLIGDVLIKKGGNGDYLKVSKGESSSYSIVIAVPGCDRIFLHSPAVNDTFTSDDIDFSVIAQARLMHLGYPPLMRQLYLNEGAELTKILKKAKECGACTSIDTAYPDPSSQSGKSDWDKIFKNALPYTDIFTPSIEEILLMLDKPQYDALKAKDDDILKNITMEMISKIGEKLIGMGAKIVVLKCGTLGYYVKTASKEALSSMSIIKNAEEWADKELFSGIFYVEKVASATGAGDTSIAGFLASILKGYKPEQAINIACATGAYCVTSFGAVDAIVPLEEIAAKVDSGWEKRKVEVCAKDFTYCEQYRIYTK
ncbi:MAG: carbohydrate kinase family protein [Christensenellaceae bacterium]